MRDDISQGLVDYIVRCYISSESEEGKVSTAQEMAEKLLTMMNRNVEEIFGDTPELRWWMRLPSHIVTRIRPGGDPDNPDDVLLHSSKAFIPIAKVDFNNNYESASEEEPQPVITKAHLANRVRALIRKYPEGLNCNQICSKYLLQYHTVLSHVIRAHYPDTKLSIFLLSISGLRMERNKQNQIVFRVTAKKPRKRKEVEMVEEEEEEEEIEMRAEEYEAEDVETEYEAEEVETEYDKESEAVPDDARYDEEEGIIPQFSSESESEETNVGTKRPLPGRDPLNPICKPPRLGDFPLRERELIMGESSADPPSLDDAYNISKISVGSSTPTMSSPRSIISTHLSHYAKQLKGAKKEAETIGDIVDKIQSILAPRGDNAESNDIVDDRGIAECIEAMGDYILNNNKSNTSIDDDNKIVLSLIPSLIARLQGIETYLTNDNVYRLFHSMRKLQPTLHTEFNELLRGAKSRLDLSIDKELFKVDCLAECFFYLRNFPCSNLLKEVMILLGVKLEEIRACNVNSFGQRGSNNGMQSPRSSNYNVVLNPTQYSMIVNSFKSFNYIDADLARLLNFLNTCVLICPNANLSPINLEEVAKQSLLEVKYMGKGIVNMMHSTMASAHSENQQNDKHSNHNRNPSAVFVDPLLNICTFVAIKIYDLVHIALSSSLSIVFDEDLLVYVMQILKGQSSEDKRTRQLIDGIARYGKLMLKQGFKPKELHGFFRTVLIFISNMEDLDSNHEEVCFLLEFLEGLLVYYRNLPVEQTELIFDSLYRNKAKRYQFASYHMRYSLKNMSSSSKAVMGFVVALRPWLEDPKSIDWDLERIGQSYVGLRRMTDVYTAVNAQDASLVLQFRRCIESITPLSFRSRKLSDKFIKLIAKYLRCVDENHCVFDFVMKELAANLQEEQRKESTDNNSSHDRSAWSMQAISDLVYSIGKRKRWTKESSLNILTLLFPKLRVFNNAVVDYTTQQGSSGTHHNIAKDLIQYASIIISSFECILIIHPIVLKWINKLLGHVRDIVSCAVDDTSSSASRLTFMIDWLANEVITFKSLYFISSGLTSIFAHHSRTSPFTTSVEAKFDYILGALVKILKEKDSIQQVLKQSRSYHKILSEILIPSQLLKLLQLPAIKYYLNKLKESNIKVDCQGLYSLIEIVLTSPVADSQLTLPYTSLAIMDCLGYFTNRSNLAALLTSTLNKVFFSSLDNDSKANSDDEGVAYEILESIFTQPKGHVYNTNDSLRIHEAMLNGSKKYKNRLRNDPNNILSLVACNLLRYLADLHLHFDRQSRERDANVAIMSNQIQDFVVLCLIIVLCYLDDLQPSQWQDLLFFCRHYTKKQTYFSVVLQCTILYLLEHCAKKAVTFLETAYGSYMNQNLVSFLKSNSSNQKEEKVRHSSVVDFLLSEQCCCLMIETVIIFNSSSIVGENTLLKELESKLKYERKSLQMIFDSFYYAAYHFPPPLFHLNYGHHISFNHLAEHFAADANREKEELGEDSFWYEMEAHAVSYLKRKLHTENFLSWSNMLEHLLIHGIASRVAIPLYHSKQNSMDRSNKSVMLRKKCDEGDILLMHSYKANDENEEEEDEDEDEEVWLCLDIFPKNKVLPSSLPRYVQWQDSHSIQKLLHVRYAAVVLDMVMEEDESSSRSEEKALYSVCEIKQKMWERVERLMNSFLQLSGLVSPSPSFT